MKVTIYSLDQMEDKLPEAVIATNVIPIKKVPKADKCKTLWEGELSHMPSEGDSLVIDIDGDSQTLYVVVTILHLKNWNETPDAAVFVSGDDDEEYE